MPRLAGICREENVAARGGRVGGGSCDGGDCVGRPGVTHAAGVAESRPWDAAAAISDLLAQNQFDTAEDIALRYANYAGNLSQRVQARDAMIWGNHLPYLVEKRRQEITREPPVPK